MNVLLVMLAIKPDQLANGTHRWELDLAITKAPEDTEAHEAAFPYLKRGNNLVAASYPYDPQAWRDQVAQLQSAQSGLDRAAPHPDHIKEAPIFVTGMPRSGTTLIEQIIAAHSHVTSMGETGFASGTVERLLCDGNTYKPVSDVADRLRSDVADRYVVDLAARYPVAKQIVDKSIQTYL